MSLSYSGCQNTLNNSSFLLLLNHLCRLPISFCKRRPSVRLEREGGESNWKEEEDAGERYHIRIGGGRVGGRSRCCFCFCWLYFVPSPSSPYRLSPAPLWGRIERRRSFDLLISSCCCSPPPPPRYCVGCGCPQSRERTRTTTTTAQSCAACEEASKQIHLCLKASLGRRQELVYAAAFQGGGDRLGCSWRR